VSINILKYIDKIPSEIGLYYFYNEKKRLIFTGISSNLKKKVLNHFLRNKNNHIIKKTKSILFSLTGNKTIAVLKMKNEVKNLPSLHNKKENFLKSKTKVYKKNSNYPYDNFLIVDKGREIDEFSFLYIKNKKFKGYGFFELNHQIKDNLKITSRIIEMSEDPEIKNIILKLINKKNYSKIIQLNN